MKVLVVEDDEKIASFLTKGLEEEVFAADRAADGLSGLKMASSDRYDAAVVAAAKEALAAGIVIQPHRGKNAFLTGWNQLPDKLRQSLGTQ